MSAPWETLSREYLEVYCPSAVDVIDALVTERDEAVRDWQQYVCEVKDEEARAVAAEARADRLQDVLERLLDVATVDLEDAVKDARSALAASSGGEAQ